MRTTVRGLIAPMPTYTFRCAACGPFDRRASIADVPDAVDCPACGTPAPRGVSAPALTAPGATGLRIDAAHERSAHAPGVVSSVPRGPGPAGGPRRVSASPDPRHARLPRP